MKDGVLVALSTVYAAGEHINVSVFVVLPSARVVGNALSNMASTDD